MSEIETLPQSAPFSLRVLHYDWYIYHRNRVVRRPSTTFVHITGVWLYRICTVDFESGLISAARYQFSSSIIMGCYFHL